jgi:hypothetical protein
MSYLEELAAPRFAPIDAFSPDCPVVESNESVLSVPLHERSLHEQTANRNACAATSPLQASPSAVGIVTTEPVPEQNAARDASSGDGPVPSLPS